ncbi:regulatory protein RecX [Sesbania bispinosa]|nr:regulatory protein RecX [Sesbania bispinosa]
MEGVKVAKAMKGITNIGGDGGGRRCQGGKGGKDDEKHWEAMAIKLLKVDGGGELLGQ